MTISRQFAFATLAAPLALGLAACSGEAETELEERGPIDAIEAPEGTNWLETVEVTDYDGYLLGNPDAPVKVVEYASLTCPACAQFSANGASQLKEQYVSTGVVSFELRNQVQNAFDLTLAALVRCSAPESFHPLADQVWSNLPQFSSQFGAAQQAIVANNVPEDQIYVAAAQETGMLDFFSARGISRDQARACLSDVESVRAIGDRSDEQSEELQVTGTPTFFVNGARVDGIRWADLEPVLQTAGARPAM
ncbi:thioredoxin domain-containing protein [Aurantiacibacter gangjinensis]|nr:thioredoxin domain-containing protein [Aurantiacibacter gangjinensis]APE28242.1 Periplasmic thiol:disulfide interchange protein DsbA [Aurantiacibacter gangjinensis]